MAVSFGGADIGFSFFGIEIGIGIGIGIVDRLLFPNLVASVAVTAEHRVHPVDFILPHNSAISFIDPDPDPDFDFDFDFDYANRVLLSIASLTCEVGLISPPQGIHKHVYPPVFQPSDCTQSGPSR